MNQQLNTAQQQINSLRDASGELRAQQAAEADRIRIGEFFVGLPHKNNVAAAARPLWDFVDTPTVAEYANCVDRTSANAEDTTSIDSTSAKMVMS